MEKIKLKWLAVQRPILEPKAMPEGSIELWSIPDYDNGAPNITVREAIGSSKKLVYSGDVLLSKIVPHIRRAWIVGNSDLPKVASTEWLTFQSNKVLPEFLRYALITDDFNREMMINSSGMGSLLRADPTKVGEQLVPFPCLKKQKAIVAYLNSKLSKLDLVIKDKEKLLSLLSNYRQSLITQAVTKGLDPNVEMKDSGLQWIGSIPKKWSVQSIQHVVERISDLDHYMPPSAENGYPYLMTGNLQEKISEVNFGQCKKISASDFHKLSVKSKPERGDIILARYATIGTCSLVDVDDDFLVSYSCVTIKPRKGLLGEYLFFCLKSHSFATATNVFSNTSTQANLGIETLKQIKIAVPPLSEQKNIVDYLNKRIRNIDKILCNLENLMEKYHEYRSSLISAAITGKLNIKEVMHGK